MRIDRAEPGIWVSSAGHALALVAGLVAFSGVKSFEPAEEAIAVEIVTDSAVSQITRGEKTAPAVQPTPRPRAERVAEKTELKEAGEDKTDTPAPARRPAEIKVDDKPVEAAAPSPPPRPAQAELPRPEPVKPEPPRPDPVKLAEQAELEARQKAEAQAKAKAEADARAKAEKARKEAEVKAKAKAEAEAVAKREAEIAKSFSPTDIRRLLQSKDRAQSTGATAQEVNKTASLGSPTANAPRLNPSLRGRLVGLLRDQMERCYAPDRRKRRRRHRADSRHSPQFGRILVGRSPLDPGGQRLARPFGSRRGAACRAPLRPLQGSRPIRPLFRGLEDAQRRIRTAHDLSRYTT